MPKSIPILLLCLLPVIGTAQSARKLNKQLKAAYAVKYHDADSVKQLYEMELALWESTKKAFYDTIYSFRALDRKYEALGDSLNHKRFDLERLGVEKVNGVDYEYLYTFFHKSQEAEFIFSPFFDRLGFLDVVLGTGVYLDSASGIELFEREFQNKYLQQELESIDRFYTAVAYDRKMIAESLLKMDTAQTQITGVKQTMKEMVPALRQYNVLLEKEWNAKKQLFAKNGPKGFDEAYFDVFPDVFPPKISEHIYVEPIRVEGFDMEGPFEPESENIAPPVEDPKEEDAYKLVDEPAEFPGGITAMKDFIKKNLKMPEIARDLGLEGRSIIRFIVGIDGSISSVEVVRGMHGCDECDREAMRMIKSMPPWAPGKISGKPVKSVFHLPVKFAVE